MKPLLAPNAATVRKREGQSNEGVRSRLAVLNQEGGVLEPPIEMEVWSECVSMQAGKEAMRKRQD